MNQSKNFENKLIEVCRDCHKASCWHGEFLCLDSANAGTELRPVSELRILKLEHASHWTDENLKKIFGEIAPHGYRVTTPTTPWNADQDPVQDIKDLLKKDGIILNRGKVMRTCRIHHTEIPEGMACRMCVAGIPKKVIIHDPINNAVRDYWQSFYVNKGLCSLCGNRGFVDTTGTKSYTGIEVGRKDYCFCPNGQHSRKQEIKI